MKILVCGGRKYGNSDYLFGVLDAINYIYPVHVLISGDAPGADSLAIGWAWQRNVKIEGFPADWATYGKAAGPIRNKLMLDQRPDMIVAFPGGAGTNNMVEITLEEKSQYNLLDLRKIGL